MLPAFISYLRNKDVDYLLKLKIPVFDDSLLLSPKTKQEKLREENATRDVKDYVRVESSIPPNLLLVFDNWLESTVKEKNLRTFRNARRRSELDLAESRR